MENSIIHSKKADKSIEENAIVPIVICSDRNASVSRDQRTFTSEWPRHSRPASRLPRATVAHAAQAMLP